MNLDLVKRACFVQVFDQSQHWNAPAFFVVYNIYTTQVAGIFANTSDELFHLFEHHCDFFRLRWNSSNISFIGSCSSNDFMRDIHRTQKTQYVTSAKNTYKSFMMRHLSSLPFNPQSILESPYLDPALFIFDEKYVSQSDRSYQCCDYPIKFLSRRTGAIKFKVHPGPPANRTSPRNKRWMSYLFHPVLPFVISIQFSPLQPLVVNVHLRLVD